MLFKALEGKGNFELDVVAEFALDLECQNLLVKREGLDVVRRESVEFVRVGPRGPTGSRRA